MRKHMVTVLLVIAALFAGGDSQYDGMSYKTWKDMETPVAKAAGPVDVMKADHHGVTNTNGHVLVRVYKGGAKYRVCVISDSDEAMTVRRTMLYNSR